MYQPCHGGFSTPISGFSFVSGLYKFAGHFPLEGTGMRQCSHVHCVPILLQTIDYPIRVPAELRPM